MSSSAIGIDLGTTFSAVAHVNQYGVPEIIPNAEGDRITPSVILFDDNEVIVGNYAKQSAVAYPTQVVDFIKRHMGEDDYTSEYANEQYTPERLSSFILGKLKHDAEVRLETEIKQAVITVPAYFGDKQRRATMMAGEMVGLQVLKLVNEPTAAAFAYGLDHRHKDKKVLVFDLGGGTFDVTIVHILGRDLNVLASVGDHLLGGKDWDDALIALCAEKFKEKHGIDPLDDIAAHHDLRQKCVNAKISLSRRPKVNIFYDHAGKILRQGISRDHFENLTSPLLHRCELLSRDVLEDANLKPTDIDIVLLAGGSTRMPMVRSMLTRVFEREPSSEINPDECVALGAALTAALESARLEGKAPPVDIRTHDVTSHSLGMVVFRESKIHNSRIIKRNSRIPCERTCNDYVTTNHNQSTFDLWLVQGENPDPMDCTVLGHFEFYGIPPRPKGQSRLGVTYRYNANGIVEVEAMDLFTGQNLPHRISVGLLTLDDLINHRIPVHIALLMDCSGSMYGNNLKQAKRAAWSFVKRAHQPGRRFAVLPFPNTAGPHTPLTDDRDSLYKAIWDLLPIGSSKLSHSLKHAGSLLKASAGVQRVFIIFTDGHLDDPQASSTEAHRIRIAGGRIKTVALGHEPNRKLLERLASQPSDCHIHDEAIELGMAPINLPTELANRSGA